MDDDDFDDLLAGVDELSGSFHESLTNAAADLDINTDESFSTSQSTAPTVLGDSVDEGSCRKSSSEFQSKCHSASLDTGAIAMSPVSKPRSVAEKIESIFLGIANSLQSKSAQIFIALKAAPSAAHESTRVRNISFPGTTAEGAWRFSVVIRIMELIHEAIRQDMVISKRDIYYRDPALFGSQAVVNRYVDSIAYTLGVPRSSLNVTAAAKGLIAGAVQVCRRDGSIIDVSAERDGLLIPALRDVLSVNMASVRWVLVIEKEASFRSIAASGFWDQVSARGVMVTGKGYPDIATRAMLHFMSTPSPRNGFASPPVYCLVDYDPDGLAIMSTYKNGSAASAHQNEELRLPHLQWLGLRCESLIALDDDVHSSQGLLELTARDRRKAIAMLERSREVSVDAHESEVRSVLQTLLMLNTKAELQLLDATPAGMTDLLTAAVAHLA